MSEQPHGSEAVESLAVGAKFKQDRITFEVVTVTPAMVLARSGRRGRESERWFWKKTLENESRR